MYAQSLVTPAIPTMTGLFLAGLCTSKNNPSLCAKENVDITSLRESIVTLIENDAEKREDGTSLIGTFIRLAWHCVSFLMVISLEKYD